MSHSNDASHCVTFTSTGNPVEGRERSFIWYSLALKYVATGAGAFAATIDRDETICFSSIATALFAFA